MINKRKAEDIIGEFNDFLKRKQPVFNIVQCEDYEEHYYIRYYNLYIFSSERELNSSREDLINTMCFHLLHYGNEIKNILNFAKDDLLVSRIIT